MTDIRIVPPHNAAWRTSSRSSATNCVEVAAVGGGIAVRDSKDRGGPVLRFARGPWLEFLAATKAGEFDRR
jgi:Domain of unknown function (DUF397)